MSHSNLSPFVINWFVDKQTIPRIPCLIVTCRHLWRIGLSATFPSFFAGFGLVLVCSMFSSSIFILDVFQSNLRCFRLSYWCSGTLCISFFFYLLLSHSLSFHVCFSDSGVSLSFPSLYVPLVLWHCLHFYLSLSLSVSVVLSACLSFCLFLSLSLFYLEVYQSNLPCLCVYLIVPRRPCPCPCPFCLCLLHYCSDVISVIVTACLRLSLSLFC